jgi:hypothetical protein
MLMTVPQVLAVWIGRDAGGVSLASWLAYLLAACLWWRNASSSTIATMVRRSV